MTAGAHARPDRNAGCRRARGLVRLYQSQRLIAREHELDGADDNALEGVGDDRPQTGPGRRLICHLGQDGGVQRVSGQRAGQVVELTP